MNSVINEGHLDWENSLHKSYIRSIMMTAADLSGQGKPYEIAKRLVENVLKEFYEEVFLFLFFHPFSYLLLLFNFSFNLIN